MPPLVAAWLEVSIKLVEGHVPPYSSAATTTMIVVSFQGMVGQFVGSYKVLRLIGEGGMGAVYEAVNDSIERRVAIKILHAEAARREQLVARFFNEARAANRIDHPSMVQINEHGQLPDGTAYIVMELLKGETLAQHLRGQGGQPPVSIALQIAWQVATGLAAAHLKGIIHRDLKPGNLMLVPDPLVPGGVRVKILDFGIAKLISDSNHAKTASQLVMGTPTYMSPEQCKGAGAVDDKADVYSLGVILYEMLAGRPPFIAEGAGELIGMHLFQQPPPIEQNTVGVPENVCSLIRLLLTKDRSARPAMADVVKELAKFIADNSITVPPNQPPKPPSEIPFTQLLRPNTLHQSPTVFSIEMTREQTQLRQHRRFKRLAIAALASITVAASAGAFWMRKQWLQTGASAGQSSLPLQDVQPTSSNPPILTPAQPEIPLQDAQPTSPNLSIGASAKSRIPPTSSNSPVKLSTVFDVPTRLEASGSRTTPKSQPLNPDPPEKKAATAATRTKSPLPPETRGGSDQPTSETKLAPVSEDQTALTVAETYLRQGRYDQAIQVARGQGIAPTEYAQAWRIIGAAACRKKDPVGAYEAWSHLSAANRRQIEADCAAAQTVLRPVPGQQQPAAAAVEAQEPSQSPPRY